MTLSTVLDDYADWLQRHHPDQIGQYAPGLDDEGIDRLRAAVAPLSVPAQVEALYRWRDGGHARIFGGWRMRSLDELLSWREFCLDDLEEPPLWLQLFDDQCLAFVTLELPGFDGDTSLWYCHTHDNDVARISDSIEATVLALLDVTSARELHDAAKADLLFGTGDGGSLDGSGIRPYLLRRSPTAYEPGAQRPGSVEQRGLDDSSPASWLASVGIADADLVPRGATHTIAELLDRAQTGDATGTIVGSVEASGGIEMSYQYLVSDGTGSLSISSRKGVLPAQQGENEFDVVVFGPGSTAVPFFAAPAAEATAIRRSAG